MPQGLQVFDWEGKKTLDITSSLVRIIGKVDLMEKRGKVPCDEKRKWMYAYHISDGASYPVKISAVADAIEWEYVTDLYGYQSGSYTYGMRLVYGSY